MLKFNRVCHNQMAAQESLFFHSPGFASINSA